MSEDVFYWIVSVAAILACFAFIAQAIILAAVYRAGKRAQQAGKDAQHKIGSLVDHFDAILQTTSKMLEENRPRIDEITAEAAVITKAVRQQADRIGALIDDANERTRARLAQIDRTVDQTVEHVEQAGDAVKSAVMRPVKEVNGLLNGVKAAVSTYAQGGLRPSVARATQDEEMFI